MKEIELYEFNKRDSEMLAELIMDYLSEKGIHPEIWSYQIKVFIDSEVEQV